MVTAAGHKFIVLNLKCTTSKSQSLNLNEQTEKENEGSKSKKVLEVRR
jgi:hypothetical protein